MLIAGGGLVAVAATSIVLLRRHEQSNREAHARRFGWVLDDDVGTSLSVRLRGLTLFEVGHSRRIEGSYRKDGSIFLFQYLCETGFEHRRQTHRWSVVVAPLRHNTGAAVLTTEDWLAVTAELPGRKTITREPAKTGVPRRWIIADDEQAWQERLSGPIGKWLDNQPAGRTWEVLSEFVVGYEGGSPGESAFIELAEAARRVSSLLTTAEQVNPALVASH